MNYSEKKRKADIRELQNYLYCIHLKTGKIPSVIPDGFYDENTRNAVKTFQNLYSLPETGETDRSTWETIARVHRHLSCSTPEPLHIFPSDEYCVNEGESGTLVFVLQAMLMTLNHEFDCLPEINVSGIYDRHTSDAIRHIQKLAFYPETGTTDKYTWNNIIKIFSHSVK